MYNETQRWKKKKNISERLRYRKRDRRSMQLRKAETVPQQNKDTCYNQSFPQVFPEIFYKYSIASFPDRHAWDVHYETLRIGLRRIRNSLDESLTYFCACLSLMKLLLQGLMINEEFTCVCPHVCGCSAACLCLCHC